MFLTIAHEPWPLAIFPSLQLKIIMFLENFKKIRSAFSPVSNPHFPPVATWHLSHFGSTRPHRSNRRVLALQKSRGPLGSLKSATWETAWKISACLKPRSIHLKAMPKLSWFMFIHVYSYMCVYDHIYIY